MLCFEALFVFLMYHRFPKGPQTTIRSTKRHLANHAVLTG